MKKIIFTLFALVCFSKSYSQDCVVENDTTVLETVLVQTKLYQMEKYPVYEKYRIQVLAVTEKPYMLPKFGEYNTFYVEFITEGLNIYKVFLELEFNDYNEAKTFLNDVLFGEYKLCEGFVVGYHSTNPK